jgi:hypothetical protein
LLRILDTMWVSPDMSSVLVVLGIINTVWLWLLKV